jgi:integrase
MAIFRGDDTYVVHICEDRTRGRWRVDAYFCGRRRGTRAGAYRSSLAAAERLAASLWGDYVSGLLVAPDAPPATLGEMVERFVGRTTTKRGRELSPATARAYRSQLRALVKVAGEDCPIHHVTSRHVEKACTVPESQRSKAQYLRAARALFRHALAERWLDADPTASVVVHEGPVEMRPFLQPNEVPLYLDACPPAHRLRSVWILETGMRATEATHARWDWLRRGIGTWSVQIPARDPASGFRAKGGRGRI